MAAIRAFFSRLLFAAYVVGFTSLPLALLLGTTGAIAGAIAAGVFLLALRYHGSRRIAKAAQGRFTHRGARTLLAWPGAGVLPTFRESAFRNSEWCRRIR
jgi:hypothetical protein